MTKETTIAEMEARVAEFMGVDRLPTPAYGSDLNLWVVIHQTLRGRGVFSAYILALIDETSVSDRLATASIEYIVGEAIAATAEDRLHALCAVLDGMEKK